MLDLDRGAINLSALGAGTVVAGIDAAVTGLSGATPRLGLLDLPNGCRKRHSRPLPLIGGLSILFGAGLAVILDLSFDEALLHLLALRAIVTVIHSVNNQALRNRPRLLPRQRLAIEAVLAMAFVLVTGRVIRSIGAVDGGTIELGIAAATFTILICLTLRTRTV